MSSLPKPTRLWQFVPDQPVNVPAASPVTTISRQEQQQDQQDQQGLASYPRLMTSNVNILNGNDEIAGRRSRLTVDNGASSPVIDPCDVAFIGPYTFVVADSTGHRLVVADIARNICSVIGNGEVWPNGVDVTSDGKILVTDRRHKGVSVYDAERGDRLTVWTPGEDVLKRPHGIAVTPRGEAIVTDTARSSVCVFSVRDGGRLIRRFGSRGDQLQQLRLPFYCAYDDRRDEILVTDNMNYCVKIFDGGRSSTKTGNGNGPFLRRIGSGNAFGQRQFQCPYGLTVDPFSRNILVADYETHRVFEFDGSGSGRFLRYALTYGDGCRGPCGVAVGPDCGTLVVAESSGDVFAGSGMTPAAAAQTTSWTANVKAYRLHEGTKSSTDESQSGGWQQQQAIVFEQVWNFKTESAV